MIELKKDAVFYGPNPYAMSPVIVVSLRVQPALEPRIGLLCDALRAQFPAWFDRDMPAGAAPAVTLGRTAAHWALCALNDVRGYLHDAGARPAPEGAQVWLGFHDESLSRNALQLAFKALLQGERPEFSRESIQRELVALLQACGRRHPDYQAQILMQAARASDIPVRPFVSGTKFWLYGWGNRSRVFLECAPMENGGKKVTGSKVLSKAVFQAVGAPVPTHHVVNTRAELEAAAKAIGWPCVVKPVQGNKGKGVTAGIQSYNDLLAAFDEATRSDSGAVMVETHIPGDDHRLLVAEGRLVRAIRRQPSSLIGDGRHSVGQLLEELNKGRTGPLLKSRYLRPVPTDQVLLRHLAGQGVSLDSVLQDGRRITLRSNANISTGGDATDVTDSLHPHTGRMAELIAASLGLVTAGVDFITSDISRSFLEAGAFIEVNSNPGLGMAIASGNDPVEIGKHVLGNKPGRIPVTLVVMQETELPEAGRWLLSQHWPVDTAWACGRMAGIGECPLRVTGASPWSASDTALKHRAVGHLWIFCSDRELLQAGLPVDRLQRVVLCDTSLPEEWAAVVSARADRTEPSSDWRAVVTADAASRSSPSQ